jgi:hypothetical protein
VVGIWLLVRPKALGNINSSYKEPTTSSSNFSFKGEKGQRIKFSFASEIKNGELDIVLNNSSGQVIYELDKAKELQTFYTLDHSDTYTLSAEYTDFIGSYRIAVYPVK